MRCMQCGEHMPLSSLECPYCPRRDQDDKGMRGYLIGGTIIGAVVAVLSELIVDPGNRFVLPILVGMAALAGGIGIALALIFRKRW